MHQIRLRGPWEYEPLVKYLASGESQRDGLAAAGRIQMPADWGEVLGADFHGQVRFTRFFHRPTGLSEIETVRLVVEQVDCRAELTINDHPLGNQDGTDVGRYDITTLLKPHNNLTIRVELPRDADSTPPRPTGRLGMPGGIPGEVRLEIE